MRVNIKKISVLLGLGVIAVGSMAWTNQKSKKGIASVSEEVHEEQNDLLKQGKKIFRFDTFGDEQFWTDALKMNQAIAGKSLDGSAGGVSPKAALSVGLKVDVDALPKAVKDGLKSGQINLDDPKVTLSLLQLEAVLGVKGHFDKNGRLSSVGITCALCHSTVDNSFAPSIGKRLDGWPNRDLNVGAIVNLSPDLSSVSRLLEVDDATVRKVLTSWGPGKYDAMLFLDGKAFRPDGQSAATVIPAAFGLAGVNAHTYTGWGSVPYWNAFVAVLEMHGQGRFTDSRLNDATKFPVAAKNKFAQVESSVDLVTSKLPALQVYQLSLAAPSPAKESYDSILAVKGAQIFNGKAKCATCHTPPLYTDAGWNMHSASEIGIDNFQSSRSPDGQYRTTPLKGLFTRETGGFYHDGRFANYKAVVEHYNQHQKLQLNDQEQKNLIEFLKSL